MAESTEKQIETTKLLIENGADISIRDNDNRTILMHLVHSASLIDVMKLLISKGIDLNAKDKVGNTAQSYAIQNACSPESIALLRENGATQ